MFVWYNVLYHNRDQMKIPHAISKLSYKIFEKADLFMAHQVEL